MPSLSSSVPSSRHHRIREQYCRDDFQLLSCSQHSKAPLLKEADPTSSSHSSCSTHRPAEPISSNTSSVVSPWGPSTPGSSNSRKKGMINNFRWRKGSNHREDPASLSAGKRRVRASFYPHFARKTKSNGHKQKRIRDGAADEEDQTSITASPTEGSPINWRGDDDLAYFSAPVEYRIDPRRDGHRSEIDLSPTKRGRRRLPPSGGGLAVGGSYLPPLPSSAGSTDRPSQATPGGGAAPFAGTINPPPLWTPNAAGECETKQTRLLAVHEETATEDETEFCGPFVEEEEKGEDGDKEFHGPFVEEKEEEIEEEEGAVEDDGTEFHGPFVEEEKGEDDDVAYPTATHPQERKSATPQKIHDALMRMQGEQVEIPLGLSSLDPSSTPDDDAGDDVVVEGRDCWVKPSSSAAMAQQWTPVPLVGNAHTWDDDSIAAIVAEAACRLRDIDCETGPTSFASKLEKKKKKKKREEAKATPGGGRSGGARGTSESETSSFTASESSSDAELGCGDLAHPAATDRESQSTLLALRERQPEVLSVQEEERVSVYRSMLKMSVPIEAVRHRMHRDRVDERLIIAVLGAGGEPNRGEEGDHHRKSSDTSSSGSSLNARQEELAAPYRNMLRMRVPIDAVRHKMNKDRVDPKIIQLVVGEDDDGPGEPGEVAALTERKAPVVAASDLATEAEETIASSYRKMLKMHVPEGAVLQKMRRDATGDKVIRAVLGKEALESSTKPPPTSGSSPTINTGRRSTLVSLHWTPLKGEELDESVWSGQTGNRNEGSVVEPQGSEMSKLLELFRKKSTKVVLGQKNAPRAVSKVGAGQASKSGGRILPLVRSNNLAIRLKVFKEFSFDELADTVRFLDPLGRITGERVQFLRDLLPTSKEATAVRDLGVEHHDDGHHDDGGPDPDAGLAPAEQWFRRIVSVERSEEKVLVLRTMEMLPGEVSGLRDGFSLLDRVCRRVVKSSRLRDLLGATLSIGNVLNDGTRVGGAAGFKFDSLLKLTQTKSSDGKTTVLDFLVTVLVSKGQRDILDLSSDIPECQEASRLPLQDMLSGVRAVERDLNQCRRELDALKEEEAAHGYGDHPQSDHNVQSAIARLEGFLGSGEAMHSQLEHERDVALEACREMSRYCAENGEVGITGRLLGILFEFASNLRGALKKHDETEARKQRSKRTGEKITSALDDKEERQNRHDRSFTAIVGGIRDGNTQQTQGEPSKGDPEVQKCRKELTEIQRSEESEVDRLTIQRELSVLPEEVEKVRSELSPPEITEEAAKNERLFLLRLEIQKVRSRLNPVDTNRKHLPEQKPVLNEAAEAADNEYQAFSAETEPTNSRASKAEAAGGVRTNEKERKRRCRDEADQETKQKPGNPEEADVSEENVRQLPPAETPPQVDQSRPNKVKAVREKRANKKERKRGVDSPETEGKSAHLEAAVGSVDDVRQPPPVETPSKVDQTRSIKAKALGGKRTNKKERKPGGQGKANLKMQQKMDNPETEQKGGPLEVSNDSVDNVRQTPPAEALPPVDQSRSSKAKVAEGKRTNKKERKQGGRVVASSEMEHKSGQLEAADPVDDEPQPSPAKMAAPMDRRRLSKAKATKKKEPKEGGGGAANPEKIPAQTESYSEVSLSFLAPSVTPEFASRVFDEALRILRPGGVVFVVDWNGSTVQKIPTMRHMLTRIAASEDEEQAKSNRAELRAQEIMETNGMKTFDPNDPQIVRWKGVKASI